MVVKEIDQLREKLDVQILEHKSFDEIYSTSIKLDKLITQYYMEKGLTKKVQKV